MKFKPLVYVSTFTNTPFVFNIVTQSDVANVVTDADDKDVLSRFDPFVFVEQIWSWSGKLKLSDGLIMRKIDKQPFPGIEGKNFFDERRFFWRKRDKKVKVSGTLMCQFFGDFKSKKRNFNKP
jgi:hypothetical protein